jgi:hypothetical protein
MSALEKQEFRSFKNSGAIANVTIRTERPKLVVLAPAGSAAPTQFANFASDADLHEQLLSRMQYLRGKIYLAEGAIREDQISGDGCHRQWIDKQSWHLLLLDRSGMVIGCARYTAYPNTVSFAELGVAKSPLAASTEWGGRFRSAVQSQIELARQRGVSYVEVGGWALAPELRCSVEALRIALATYGMARLLGGCIGIGTVTRRNNSASILRRIGGQSLTGSQFEIPPYFDPHYGCDMEILSFDSEKPNQRLGGWIDEMYEQVLAAPLIRTENSILRLHQALTTHGTEAAKHCGRTPFVPVRVDCERATHVV